MAATLTCTFLPVLGFCDTHSCFSPVPCILLLIVVYGNHLLGQALFGAQITSALSPTFGTHLPQGSDGFFHPDGCHSHSLSSAVPGFRTGCSVMWTFPFSALLLGTIWSIGAILSVVAFLPTPTFSLACQAVSVKNAELSKAETWLSFLTFLTPIACIFNRETKEEQTLLFFYF